MILLNSYFFGNLLVNAMIFILYGLALTEDYQPCLTKSGFNISERFRGIFIIGVSIHAVDFMSTNIITIILKAL